MPRESERVGCGSQAALFEPVDVVTQFERRAQLQSQVLHHHLAFQQEQGVAVYLLQRNTGSVSIRRLHARHLADLR